VAVVGRYPTWMLLLAAVISVGALAGLGWYLDRSSPGARRIWVRLLAAYLVILALAWAGVIPSRGGLITPNEGLLVVTDLMVAMLVVLLPAAWWRRRRGAGRHQVSGLRGVLLGLLACALVGALLFGEIDLASALPPTPATAACDDYRTWVLAPGNATPPPVADQAVLAKAAREAPAGRLKQALTALLAEVQATGAAWGTAQGYLDEQQTLSYMGTVTADCRSVPQQ